MLLPICIIVVCFFDFLIALLTPSTETMIFVTDGSAARYGVDFIGLLVGMIALYKYGFVKLNNKPLIALMLFLIVSHFHAVNIHFAGAFIPNDMAIYDYKPMMECVLFFMMFMGILSLPIMKLDIDKVKETIAWTGTAYGLISIMQRFGLDQFYKIMDVNNIEHMSRNPEVGGFICQPVFCAALITMTLPFMLTKIKWHQLSLALGGILATGNRSSLIVAAICVLYFYQCNHVWRAVLAAYVIYLILGVLFVFINMHIPHFQEERFKIWHDVLLDIGHSRCPGINNSHILTGIGLGSFSVVFPFYYTGWYQAHNEFLECIRTIGIIGLGLLIAFICKIPRRDISIVSSLLASFLLSLTNATWHIPQLAFLTVLLVALLFKTEDLYVSGLASPRES